MRRGHAMRIGAVTVGNDTQATGHFVIAGVARRARFDQAAGLLAVGAAETQLIRGRSKCRANAE